MISGHYFRYVRDQQPLGAPSARPGVETLLEALSCQVIGRYIRLNASCVGAIPLALRDSNEEDPPPNPCHPACAECASSDYCRESWQLHLAELNGRPRTHWHTCDHKRFCAVVPVVCQGRCLAAVKLASPVSMGEGEFERHVELMDLLVRDFSLSQADVLACVLRDTVAVADPDPSTPGVPPGLGAWKGAGTHPQILRALEHIDEHLCDPKLTVARIARELDIHPYYLSHLFADQVGQRMSRLIAAKRVELAKTLLATTHWQIKRIAHETGHANPNWFSHVFSIHTGVTPSAYRRKTRIRSREA